MAQTQFTTPPTRRFWALPVLVALLALAVRLALIAALPDGRDDLHIYYYFGSMMEQGLNPYTPPADGPINPHYANMAPLNLALFAATLRVWDSQTALRVLFALVDAAVILSIGYLAQRPRPWRRAVLWFYALNPFVLMALVVMSEDKVVVLWLMIVLIASVEARRQWPSVLLTTVITLYRWVGAFFILPLAVYFARTWRSLALSLGLFALLFALSHVPYWPDNLWVYQSRAHRAGFYPPIHSSPTQILYALGLYTPRLVPVTIFGSLAVLYTLFAFRRISLVETIVLSLFCTNIVAPELPHSRIIMIAFPLLLLIGLSRRRVALLWAATTLAALFVHADLARAFAGRWLPGLQTAVEFALRPIPNLLLMNLFAGVLLVYYAVDKWRGLVDTSTLLGSDLPVPSAVAALPLEPERVSSAS